jgi:mannitol-1-phosphate 5-dehydrogenase
MSGRLEVDKHKIVIFGAGKIGRSFIGQLFGCAGYKVVFIDINQTIVNSLNQAGRYRVVIKGEKEEEIIVPNVQAISALEKEKVIEAVSTAGILAVSIGKNVLEQIIPVIADGLELRNANNKGTPLDIILAENMRSAADFMREHLMKKLPYGFPLDANVGLVETSIGKMVPIIPLAELEKDPLVVFAEPYNTLILDGKGFKSPVPGIKGLAPKSNIKAWVDRKAFIHNLGHATAAYYGFALHKDAVYLHEVLEDNEVLLFTRAVMLQSAEILRATYPGEFSATELKDHIDELIHRFRNKALGDTLFRVGHDLIRKLGPDDRFMGSIHFAMQYQMQYNLILRAMSYGLHFRAKDEEGNCFPSDSLFLRSLEKDFETTLTELLGYDKVLDLQVIEELNRLYRQSGMLTEEGLLQ